eukprot:9475082-Pyramimonas_sp.AAC.1
MAAQYGVEINRVDNQELLGLRRQAMPLLTPTTRCASLSAKLALHGGPAVREAMGPALQWSKMI